MCFHYISTPKCDGMIEKNNKLLWWSSTQAKLIIGAVIANQWPLAPLWWLQMDFVYLCCSNMTVETIGINSKPCRSLTISVELFFFTGGGGLCLGGPLVGQKRQKKKSETASIVSWLGSLCILKDKTGCRERTKMKYWTPAMSPLCPNSIEVQNFSNHHQKRHFVWGLKTFFFLPDDKINMNRWTSPLKENRFSFHCLKLLFTDEMRLLSYEP